MTYNDTHTAPQAPLHSLDAGVGCLHTSFSAPHKIPTITYPSSTHVQTRSQPSRWLLTRVIRPPVQKLCHLQSLHSPCHRLPSRTTVRQLTLPPALAPNAGCWDTSPSSPRHILLSLSPFPPHHRPLPPPPLFSQLPPLSRFRPSSHTSRFLFTRTFSWYTLTASAHPLDRILRCPGSFTLLFQTFPLLPTPAPSPVTLAAFAHSLDANSYHKALPTQYTHLIAQWWQ